MTTLIPRRRARRTAALLGAVGLLAGLLALLAPAPTASAAGLLPSTTTVTSNANPAIKGSSITYTATVKILGTNLGPITPRGTVTFTKEIDPGEPPVVIGTAPVGTCLILIKQCTASITYDPGVPEDEGYVQYFDVRARYNGDLLTKPSSGVVSQVLDFGHSCTADEACQEERTAANGSARFQVEVDDYDDPVPYEILIGFTTVPLSCSTPGTGDVAVWDVTYPEAFKIATYTSIGAAATAVSPANYDRICYSSPLPFTTASGAPAALVGSSYEGLLPMCVDIGYAGPCVILSHFTPADFECEGGCPAALDTVIYALPGDPKTGR